MKNLKTLTLLLLLVVSMAATAQPTNAFLERSFWQENPSLEIVKQKIAEGNDATAFNSNAFDAMVYALLENADLEVIKHLLSLEGNSVDKKTHDSRIYLHWAAYAGQTESIIYLLESNSSVSDLDSHGNTPLTFAANAGQKNKAIYEAFEKHGVDLAFEKSENGANLLLLVAPSLSSEDELKFFLNKGLKLDSTDNEGNGIFNYAVKKGNIDFLKLLVSKGVDYKSLNKQSGNAFLFATQGGRSYSNPLPVYEYLKSLGLEPNSITKEGYTPLHRLAYNNTDPAIFEFFLAAGANVNQKDADGNTPFLNAASRNKVAMVQLLSQDVKDFNTVNNKGQTALMLAVQSNSQEVVEFLLKKESDVFAKDSKGNTLAYYLVASFDNRNLEKFDIKLKMLQEKGVQFNITQSEGNTLYHLAAKTNTLKLLQRLASFDIDINAKNNEGLTALHLAAMKAEDDEMMKYLISKGADIKIKTDFEESPYDLASENELLQKQNTSLNFLR